MTSANIQAFFDNDTNTVSYLVSDPTSSQSAIIDSVLDFDQASGQTSTASADAVIAAVREQ
ncbi:MAG: MBL fold metallo-hydrolase, partial [Pseudomonadota bacterium]|nr:MBL fold metallo-hydrolase [Pseudomonadota bacterium]